MPEQGRRDAVGLRGRGNFHSESSASLLHLSGPDLDIERAGVEERLTQGLKIFGTQVIHVGGEQDDFSGLCGTRRSDQTKCIGIGRGVASSGSPGSSIEWPPASRRCSGREYPEENRSSWGGSFTYHRTDRRDLQPLQQNGGSRGWNWNYSVSRSNPAAAQGDRPVINPGDAQLLKPLDSGDDIYQRIHSSHFVQRHLIPGRP